ncbi:MAG: response regulator [Clostridia bacterium]|nr:response regulator [Clostridia bacterium]
MKKILVVEDSRLTFELLRRALAGHETYRVELFCKNGEGLLELYQQHRPDLVVMDIVMEGASGIEMTKKLVAAYPEARVVMLTSLSYQEVKENATQAGAVGYIQKPFKAEQVIRVFDQALS